MILQLTEKDYQAHCFWMEKALAIAKQAGVQGDIPVGAVIVDAEGNCLAIGDNQKERLGDATAHAEVVAIRSACSKLGQWRLTGCTLYVTLEPCLMCTGAIVQSRLSRLVYGVDDPKTGTIRTVFNLPDSFCSNHRLEVLPNVLEAPCRSTLQDWFKMMKTAKSMTERSI